MSQFLDLPIPGLPPGWSYFSTLQDGLFVLGVIVLIALLIVWWRQQSRNWFRITVAALLGAVLLCIASFYLFTVSPYSVGCADMCTGWRGFPRPVAIVALDNTSLIGPVDFATNLLVLWLILLTATVLWRILIISVDWGSRSIRTRFLLILFFWLVPWGLLPRFLGPPQPVVGGEDLRVANNAIRAAEFTYNITGLWIQRLAIEDVRSSEGIMQQRTVGDILASEDDNGTGGQSNDVVSPLSAKQVCLKGYTFFYLPWQRYRIVLEATGVSSVQMTPVPLSGSCWS